MLGLRLQRDSRLEFYFAHIYLKQLGCRLVWLCFWQGLAVLLVFLELGPQVLELGPPVLGNRSLKIRNGAFLQNGVVLVLTFPLLSWGCS